MTKSPLILRKFSTTKTKQNKPVERLVRFSQPSGRISSDIATFSYPSFHLNYCFSKFTLLPFEGREEKKTVESSPLSFEYEKLELNKNR